MTSQESTKNPETLSLVSCQLGEKTYEGRLVRLSAEEVERGIYEAEITPRDSHFLSMIYISSPAKPSKVELTLFQNTLGLCEGNDIREVPTGTNFEEFEIRGVIFPLKEKPNPNPNYKTYKVVMFGDEDYLNLRKGRKTESYFLPIHNIPYALVGIRVSFEGGVEDFSLGLELISRDKGYYLASKRGKELLALRYSSGTMGFLTECEGLIHLIQSIKEGRGKPNKIVYSCDKISEPGKK